MDINNNNSELHKIGKKHNTDKSYLHNYLHFYEKYFKKYRYEKIRILEIGIGKGESLRTWEEYFPNAEILGVDIDKSCLNNKYKSGRVKTIIGDQSDRAFLKAIEGEFDIIIDDGGHTMKQQMTSLGCLFEKLNPDGLYVVENLQTSLMNAYGGNASNSDTVLSNIYNLKTNSQINSNYLLSEEKDVIESNVEDIFIYGYYDNPKNKKDITSIIHKSRDSIQPIDNARSNNISIVDIKDMGLVLSVSVVVYNRIENIKEWISCWNKCEQLGASLNIIHNYDKDSDCIPYKKLCEENGINYIPRKNIGMDIGAFQDVCIERLVGFNNKWDVLFWATDDTVPVTKDFLFQYSKQLMDENVGVSCMCISNDVTRHIRTTGFCIKKEVSRKLKFKVDPIKTKSDCYEFEHRGKDHFLNQIESMGLRVSMPHNRKDGYVWDKNYPAISLLKKQQKNFSEEANIYPIDAIVKRIQGIVFKNYAIESRDVVWEWCLSYSSKIEINRDNLENMAKNNLVWGFFGNLGSRKFDEIIHGLAKGVGACGIENPGDNGQRLFPKKNILNLTNSDILERIERKIGFKINLPSFIGNRDVDMFETKYGIITDRHCYYLWVLKKIIELCPDRNSSIIEIGAGLGILGYYLDKAGYKDYTIIDLAYTNACQTYFLARNLPERNIIISGDVEDPFDKRHRDSLKILHSTDFKNVPKNRFSIMVNTDSLPEMKIEESTKYIKSNCAPMLLSINHEVNDYSVNEITNPYYSLKYRYPFWLRDGYVEELYVCNNIK